MFYRLTATPPPVPASAGGFPEAYDRAGTVERSFSALASTIETLAAAERLTAHKNAVTLRVNALKEQA
ncbi:hypothetical protein [Escherichia coli]|uniref:hypothetical protein n=1 Tax=Escherichia coli TaxID=562 RepID=UPI00388E4DB6